MSGEGTNGWCLGGRETTSAGEVAYEVFGEGPPMVLVLEGLYWVGIRHLSDHKGHTVSSGVLHAEGRDG